MPHHSILIIDDERDLADALCELLRAEGYEPRAAESIAAALNVLRAEAPPDFILADRMLRGEAIEVRNLEILCKAAPASKILVYTSQEELTPEIQSAIIRKGACRVINKSQADVLVKNIKILTPELEELWELSVQLEKTDTPDRSKIMAALIGSDVGVTVIDRHFRRWFRNSALDRIGGSVCGDNCRTLPAGKTNDPGGCWGCSVSEVFQGHVPVECVYLNRTSGGPLKWVAVRSTPVVDSSGKQVLAVREAVTEIGDVAMAAFSLEQRLHYIAQSLIRVGFGRARIYKSSTEGAIQLVAAATRADPYFELRSPYFENLRDLPLAVEQCPYMRIASAQREGLYIEEWDPDLGPSPYAGRLGLTPPYFDVPVRGEDNKLEGWICLDFADLDLALSKSAIVRLGRRESLSWLQDEFCKEVRLAFLAGSGTPLQRQMFEVVQRTHLGIASAKSVAEATRLLQDAFARLFPNCRVSVRSCTEAGLKEFESLCWGRRDPDVPSVIPLDSKIALTASVVRSMLPAWISNYQDYLTLAPNRGDPVGHPPRNTQSTAQLPLRFENTVFGTLSIDSPELIEWSKDGYQETVKALARDTAFVLRDLVLHDERDRAVADRAAIVAYSAMASNDALWRHWAQQRLAQAKIFVRESRELIGSREAGAEAALEDLLTQISSVITKVQAAKPVGDLAPASLTTILEQLAAQYRGSVPALVIDRSSETEVVPIPAYVLRNVLTVLVDNSYHAFQLSQRGTQVRVMVITEGSLLAIEVTDDGPGVQLEKRAMILREPVKSEIGQGIGLLYARGAMLQYGGDLVYKPTPSGSCFRILLPITGSKR